MINNKLLMIQESICRKYNAAFLEPDGDKIVGVAGSLDGSVIPLNGLRHPQTGTTSGWYIWAGEYSAKKDFFKPMHLKHLIELYPDVAPYLGLPPGWRFLVDTGQAYEDVWQDDDLLKIEDR
jgi:hypothetical protein